MLYIVHTNATNEIHFKLQSFDFFRCESFFSSSLFSSLFKQLISESNWTVFISFVDFHLLIFFFLLFSQFRYYHSMSQWYMHVYVRTCIMYVRKLRKRTQTNGSRIRSIDNGNNSTALHSSVANTSANIHTKIR